MCFWKLVDICLVLLSFALSSSSQLSDSPPLSISLSPPLSISLSPPLSLSLSPPLSLSLSPPLSIYLSPLLSISLSLIAALLLSPSFLPLSLSLVNSWSREFPKSPLNTVISLNANVCLSKGPLYFYALHVCVYVCVCVCVCVCLCVCVCACVCERERGSMYLQFCLDDDNKRFYCRRLLLCYQKEAGNRLILQ